MRLRFNQSKCDLCGRCIEVCPFSGIDHRETYLEFNEACRVCRICLKQCPQGAICLEEGQSKALDKSVYQGVLVIVEHQNGEIHPVTYELIGKGRELAEKLGHSVDCVMMGSGVGDAAKPLLEVGVRHVYLYDQPQLRYFCIEPFANAVAAIVRRVQPSIILVGATPMGRSLAPRVATRFRTGLTADCTVLDVKENSDLVQIRPAFGGNIMAQIITPKHRPQLATVRYKVMDAASVARHRQAEIIPCELEPGQAQSGIQVLSSRIKPPQASIADAEVVVAVGRGLKEKKDLQMAYRLAELLGGQVGVTRPLVEAGWAEHTQQIGLSGRTVRPKLLVALGISGAVQFSASIGGAEYIFAINKDAQAPIFKKAHYGLIGDLYEILPSLIRQLEGGGDLHAIL